MRKKFFEVSLADVRKAQTELSRYLHPTPLVYNAWLSEKLGCELYLKLENMQPIGSFKIRGATYRISQLTPAEKKRGVIAASAGNHAQGVAWGSKKYGVKALIVMPKGAPLVKVTNTRALGAETLLIGDNYDEAYAEAKKIADKTGKVFVHAFEDPSVIAGQGTVALELIDQLPDMDVVIGSMGGGGLMSGVSLVLGTLKPKVKIVGCQASGANPMVQALKKRRQVILKKVDTFADGIAVIKSSDQMRSILEKNVHELIQIDDETIAAAVLTLLEKANICVEGAAAIALSAAEKMKKKLKGKKVVLLISGGNIDVNLLSRIIDRGLILAGRRLRVNVILSDRPGSLARLTELIAREGANILQAIHDRSEPGTMIDQTDVFLTLETRGPEHSRVVVKAIRENVIHLELVH